MIAATTVKPNTTQRANAQAAKFPPGRARLGTRIVEGDVAASKVAEIAQPVPEGVGRCGQVRLQEKSPGRETGAEDPNKTRDRGVWAPDLSVRQRTDHGTNSTDAIWGRAGGWPGGESQPAPPNRGTTDYDT